MVAAAARHLSVKRDNHSASDAMPPLMLARKSRP